MSAPRNILQKCIMVSLVLGLFVFLSTSRVEAVAVNVQTEGNATDVAPGAITVVVTHPLSGTPVSNLGASIGDGTTPITLPKGWMLELSLNQPTGCQFVPTQFTNHGNGIYTIWVYPQISEGSFCAIPAGDYHYVVRINTTSPTLRGSALGVFRVRTDTGYEEFAFEPLEFPFATPSDIERIAEFGRPNWSGTEPHNGIDLIIYNTLTSSKIISPTKGTIQAIDVSENPFSNPPNQLLLEIKIFINSEWSVNLVIEPSTVDEQKKTAQINAVKVRVGQVINVGDEIADLLVGDLGYPHLHYMVLRNGEPLCGYEYSSAGAKQIFDEIAVRSNSIICYG